MPGQSALLKFVSDLLCLHINKITKIITKTCLYNLDPLKPHFYKVKLGFTGVDIIFLISVQKHRLWVLVRTSTHNLYFDKKCEKYQIFLSENFYVFGGKILSIFEYACFHNANQFFL